MFKISPNECIKLNQIIFQSYTHKNSRELRKMFLRTLSELIRFDAAIFFLDGQGVNCLEDEPVYHNLMKNYMKIYSKFLVEKDEIMPYIIKNKPFYYRASDLVVQTKSDVFNNFLKPQGLFYAQGMNFVWENNYLGAVALFRGKIERDFSDKDLFLLSQFQKHLSFGLHEAGKELKIPDAGYNRLISNYQLTAREIEVIDYLLCGYSNKEICESMLIQIDTVKTHLQNIYKKLEVANRSQVQAIFYRKQKELS